MTTRDWTEYERVYNAEKAAYIHYRDVATGVGKGGRISPQKVERARAEWEAALTDRYIVELGIADELGIKRWQVPMWHANETIEKREVKR